MIPQDVRAALDKHHPAADAVEELRQLAGHDATAKHEDAWGHEIQVEYVIARPEGRFAQSRHRRHTDPRTRCDQELAAVKARAVDQADRVGIEKAGAAAEQVELSPR